MELMDTTLVNLKVISKLEPTVKLETDGILFQQIEWSIFPEWARRWWYGQSRCTTLNKIKQLYKNAFALVNNNALEKSSRDRVFEALYDSINGLVKLKQTYASDNTITAQLDVIVEDIHELIKINNYNKDGNTGRRSTRVASATGKNS